nr:hypothetical protein Iba_chr15bCG9440 [Ipomoea batatas]
MVPNTSFVSLTSSAEYVSLDPSVRETVGSLLFVWGDPTDQLALLQKDFQCSIPYQIMHDDLKPLRLKIPVTNSDPHSQKQKPETVPYSAQNSQLQQPVKFPDSGQSCRQFSHFFRELQMSSCWNSHFESSQRTGFDSQPLNSPK